MTERPDLLKILDRLDRRSAIGVMAGGLVAGCGPATQTGTEERSGSFPRRIVSLSPAATEILSGVGVFDRVVGVSDYCIHPPEVATLPRLGSWQDARLEELTALDPDLVVSGGAESDRVGEQLRTLGIEFVLISGQRIDHISADIGTIGSIVGVETAASDLIRAMRLGLESVREAVAGRTRPRVLLVVDRLPGTLRSIYAPTADSFLSEVVSVAGAEPVAIAGGVGGYAQVNLETLVALDPEIVIETIQGVPGRFTEDSMEVWRQLPSLAAVRNGRIVPIRDPSVLHPSHRIVETARRFARVIHPGVEF